MLFSHIIVNTKVKKTDNGKKNQQEPKVKNEKEKVVKLSSQSKPILQPKATNIQNQGNQTTASTVNPKQQEDKNSALPNLNTVSNGRVGNIKESAVNQKIPTSLQRDVYKQIV